MKRYLALTFLAFTTISCAKEAPRNWVKSPGVTITAFKSDPENGKQYLTVTYENFGVDTIQRLRYELITTKGGKVDTTLKEIELLKLFEPGDRHAVPRYIGETPADFDEVSVGKVWVLKK